MVSHGSEVGSVMETMARDMSSFLVETLPMASRMVRPSCSTTLMALPTIWILLDVDMVVEEKY